jgi:hypothetical protein
MTTLSVTSRTTQPGLKGDLIELCKKLQLEDKSGTKKKGSSPKPSAKESATTPVRGDAESLNSSSQSSSSSSSSDEESAGGASASIVLKKARINPRRLMVNNSGRPAFLCRRKV